MNVRFALALTVLLAAGGSAAYADPTPAPSPAPAAPMGLPANLPIPASVLNNPIVQSVLQSVTGSATRELGLDPNWSQGRVTFFKRFEMQIETAPNKYREVHLHQGTVINPRGTTIVTGMYVRASGAHQQDGSLDASDITVVRSN
jgi:hypothetical protein